MSTTHQKSALLGRAEVELLRRDPSAATRAQTAAAVARTFAKGGLSETERRLAIAILERLAHDVERQVREALSEHVKRCPFLPASIAQSLAHDVESVALPVIQYSTVLTEADLIALVRAGSPAKQLAVARRERVAVAVSDALVDSGRKPVIAALLGNEGAEIAETAYDKVLDRFGEDGEIQALVVERAALPVAVTERLIARVSGALRERLVSRHGFPPALAEELAMHGRERALSGWLRTAGSPAEIEGLVEALRRSGTLTPTLLLRALCSGELAFFETSLAALAGMDRSEAARLLHDQRRAGFHQLYRRSGLPGGLFPAFRTALDVTRQVRDMRASGWTSADAQRIVQGLVLAYDDLCPEDLETVLSRLARRRERGPAVDPVATARL